MKSGDCGKYEPRKLLISIRHATAGDYDEI